MSLRPLAVSLFSLLLAGPAWGEDGVCRGPWVGPDVVGQIDNIDITEASGLAFSREVPGRLYTHNDSGGDPIVYLLDEAGATRAEVRLPIARAIDWEDLAVGPCPAPWTARSCVFVADFGDNLEARVDVILYVFPEPPVDVVDGPITDHLAVRFRYADGAHNAESLVVGPDGRPAVLTKQDDQVATLHSFPLGWHEAEQPVGLVEGEGRNLTELGAFLAVATAADLSSEGARLALRTYGSIVLFEDGTPLPLPELYAVEPDAFEGPPEPQGEAIAWHPTRPELWTVSEGLMPTLYRYRCDPADWEPLLEEVGDDDDDSASGPAPVEGCQCAGSVAGEGSQPTGTGAAWVLAMALMGWRGRRRRGATKESAAS